MADDNNHMVIGGCVSHHSRTINLIRQFLKNHSSGELNYILMLYRTSARLCNLSKQVTGKEPNQSPKLVNVEYYKNFAKVTLNSPKTLNSLNMQMISEINAELPSLDKVSAFWIEGAGGKAFCAGGDVKTLYESR